MHPTCCLSSFLASFFKTSGLSTWMCSGSLLTTENTKIVTFPTVRWWFKKPQFNTLLTHWVLLCVSLLMCVSNSTRLQIIGWCFRFARGSLLSCLPLFALFGGSLCFLPSSPFSFQLCFTFGELVCWDGSLWGRHRNWCRSRHCCRSWNTDITFTNNYNVEFALHLLVHPTTTTLGVALTVGTFLYRGLRWWLGHWSSWSQRLLLFLTFLWSLVIFFLLVFLLLFLLFS